MLYKYLRLGWYIEPRPLYSFVYINMQIHYLISDNTLEYIKPLEPILNKTPQLIWVLLTKNIENERKPWA